MDGPVELAVAEAAEPVALGLAGGAGIGAMPARTAKALEFGMQPAYDPGTKIWAAVGVPTPD